MCAAQTLGLVRGVLAACAARLLKTQGNPQHLRLLCLLVGGEMSLSPPNTQQPALSQYPGRLRPDRLVQTRRASQTIGYALGEGPAQRIMATLDDIYGAPGFDDVLCTPTGPSGKARRGKR